MPTVAETYAGKWTEAIQVKPAPFVVDGREVAVVTPEGNMALISGAALRPDAAKDLRAWIKTNFMSPTL